MGTVLQLQEIAVCLFVLLLRSAMLAAPQSPNFDVPVVNVTATSGTTAILPCTINYVGDHKVMWMDPRGKVISMADVRIIHDQRISVERPYTKDWNLHIRQVKQNDSGEYQCQINTKPVKSKKIILHVNESPKIVDFSPDQVVKEGDTVSLWCKVSGIPYPQVTWYRWHVHDKHTGKEVIGEDGEQLKIHNISRFCEDTYECVAYNGIEPADSVEMKVTVEFPPEVQLYTKRMSQLKGKETVLDCRITANPHVLNVWRRHGDDIVTTWKYGINVYEEDRYTKTLSLRIGKIDENDYGRYKCFAENSFGQDEEVMLLYEHKTTTTTTTTTTTPRPWLIETKPVDRQDIYVKSGGGHKTPDEKINRGGWYNNNEYHAGNAAAATNGNGAARIGHYHVTFYACVLGFVSWWLEMR